MEVLTLGGKQYVKASKAAKDLGYATDYVGQLCRSGAVDAHLVGRTWYVNTETLGAHRIEKKRNSRVKAREYAKKSIEEARKLSVHETTNKAENIDIHYERDAEELIPAVKRIPIVTSKQITQPEVLDEDTPRYEIENENKKILMSGKIPVFDAEAETVLTDVTILTPKLIRKKPVPHPEAEGDVSPGPRILALEDSAHEEAVEVHIHPKTFLEKLETQTENEGRETASVEEQTEEREVESRNMPGLTLLALRLCLALMLLCALGTLFVETTFLYTEGNLDSNFNISLPEISKLLSNI